MWHFGERAIDLTLGGGLKMKKTRSHFPYGPVVNVVFANDANAFFKPNVHGESGAWIR
jgi:hypothetical protein